MLNIHFITNNIADNLIQKDFIIDGAGSVFGVILAWYFSLEDFDWNYFQLCQIFTFGLKFSPLAVCQTDDLF